jgi:hypothetical protein
MQREKLYKKKQKQQSGVGFRSNSWLFGVEKKNMMIGFMIAFE